MASGEGRRVLRIQPNSDIKSQLKARLRGGKKKVREKPETTTVEQLQNCLLEFESFDGTLENAIVFGELIALVTNARADLLANDELFREVFGKIPVLLCSDESEIRTACFRLLRLLLLNEDRLRLYLELMVDLFAVRSLDILILPKTERLEALRLLSKLLAINSNSGSIHSNHTKFPVSVIKCIHAVAVHRLIFTEPGEPEPKVDEINKAALGILLEQSVLDPMLVINSCYTDWIVRVLVSPGINNFQICGLVCRVLSSWLDDPEIREKSALQLVIEQIFAPLLDLGFFNQIDPKLKAAHRITHTLESCGNIFMNLMCTWPGFYACASTEPLLGSVVSPLKLLSYLGKVKSIGTNLDKIREMVIDVCCDFVCTPYGGKTFTSWSDTILFYSKLHQPDLFESSLRGEFVVGELNSVLVSGSGDTEYVDLLLSFRALATFFLVNFGLVQSLVRLILFSPNEPMALKATLLLGDLLRTSVSFVPKDWKQLLLSIPELIQLMTQSLLSTVASQIEKRDLADSEQPSSENAILLLHRLEEIYNISQTRPDFPSQLQLSNLFVFPHKAGHDRPTSGGKLYESDSELDGQISDAISAFLFEDKQKWTHFEFVIQHFRNLPSLLHRWQYNDKAHYFFVQITEFFAPKNQIFLKEAVTPTIVKLGSLAFRLIVRLAESEPYYNEMLERYVTEFCRELPENALYNEVFNPRNIMHTNVYLYFGITAAIGSKSYGHWMLEKSGFYQACLDLATSSTPIEYVKLVISSLNYTKTGITRVILETALTAGNESVRKWTTKFLEVLLTLRVLPDFEDFGMRLLFQQLSDPSGKVVRCAIRILNKWLLKFPKSSKQLKNVRLEILGDAGVLLEVHLYSSEECVRQIEERARSSLRYWMQTFNERYSQILEDDMRQTLTDFRRSMNGQFARLSTQRKFCQTLRAPPHIVSSLAKHPLGIQLLEEEGTIKDMFIQLREPLIRSRCLKAKAALLALGNLVGTVSDEVAARVLPSDTLELMCEYAERCAYLSVRGIAFFALNLAAQSSFGVRELIKLGWESNRHINLQEELCSQLRAQYLNNTNISNSETKNLQKGSAPNLDLLDVEEFRSCRSNSLYCRADNEAFNALRHRAVLSRRRNTSSCLSRLSESNDDNQPDAYMKELEFDVEMYSVLNNPTIQSGELLMHKAIKKDDKNRASTLAKDSTTRLLQRDFLTCVKGIDVFDKFWILSDSETSELMDYRNLLELPEGSRVSPRSKSIEKKSVFGQGLIQNSIGNNWTVCTIPREMQFVSENIFKTGMVKSRAKTRLEEICKGPPQSTNEHDPRKCLYCRAVEEKPSSGVGRLLSKHVLPEQPKLEFEQRREDILTSMAMLEVKESTYQTRLANHYKSCSGAFQHPCIYSDALRLLDEFPYSLETRSFIHQLFWKSMTQLTQTPDNKEGEDKEG